MVPDSPPAQPHPRRRTLGTRQRQFDVAGRTRPTGALRRRIRVRRRPVRGNRPPSSGLPSDPGAADRVTPCRAWSQHESLVRPPGEGAWREELQTRTRPGRAYRLGEVLLSLGAGRGSRGPAYDHRRGGPPIRGRPQRRSPAIVIHGRCRAVRRILCGAARTRGAARGAGSSPDQNQLPGHRHLCLAGIPAAFTETADTD